MEVRISRWGATGREGMFHFKKRNVWVHCFSRGKCSIPIKNHADANKLLAVKIIFRNRQHPWQINSWMACSEKDVRTLKYILVEVFLAHWRPCRIVILCGLKCTSCINGHLIESIFFHIEAVPLFVQCWQNWLVVEVYYQRLLGRDCNWWGFVIRSKLLFASSGFWHVKNSLLLFWRKLQEQPARCTLHTH